MAVYFDVWTIYSMLKDDYKWLRLMLELLSLGLFLLLIFKFFDFDWFFMVFKFYFVSYFMFIPGLIGGSTDLASSNKVYLKEFEDFKEPESP